MQQFQKFFIEGWAVQDKETLAFSWRFDNEEPFVETITFPGADLHQYDTATLKTYCDPLAIALGISYYKLFPLSEVTLEHTKLTDQQEQFRKTVYQKGLGEFYFTNKIDPYTLQGFETSETDKTNQTQPPNQDNKKLENKTLMLRGGGKDSIVSYELIKNRNNGAVENDNSKAIKDILKDTTPTDNITFFTFGRPFQIHLDTAKVAGGDHLFVERAFPLEQVKERISAGYYNGHVPVTAVISFVSALVSKLYGFREIVLSAEKSADSDNLQWKGMSINHQRSKSSEFVTMAQNYFKEYINPDLAFVNPLQDLYEREIAKLFADHKQYFPVFSSCNRNFHIKDQSPEGRWCKKCPKCLFVYMILRPFITKEEVKTIWGEELYANEDLLSLAKKIWGFVGTKPFECVGTAEESVLMTQKFIEKNPELATMLPLTNYFMNLEEQGQK